MGRTEKLYVAAMGIPPACGLGYYLELLTRALKQEKREVDLIVLKDNRLDFLQEEGVTKKLKKVVKKIAPSGLHQRVRRKRAFSYWRDYLANFNKIQPGSPILLTHVPIESLAVPISAARQYFQKILSTKFVWVIHDLHPYYFPHSWTSDDLSFAYEFLPALAASASQIIVHNEFTARSVIEHLGVGNDKVNIIRLPHILELEPEGPQISDATLLKKYKIRKPYALWAGSSTLEHKNHLRLLQAWKIIQELCAEPPLLVCTGNREPNWETLSRFITRERIDAVFTGIIPKNDMLQILKQAYLAVCPTLFEGGGCGPALEATYTGVPVACSDIPQIREQYDGRSDLCRYFDPADTNSIANSVLEIINHPKRTAEMVAAGLSWTSRRHSWADVAKQYWQVLTSEWKQ